MIKKENEDTVDFICFNVDEVVAFYTCSKSDYKNWKITRKNIIDDFLYSSEIAEMSILKYEKKCGLIVNRKISEFIDKIMDILSKSTFNTGNMTVISVGNGSYVRLEHDVYVKELDDCFSEIKTLLCI